MKKNVRSLADIEVLTFFKEGGGGPCFRSHGRQWICKWGRRKECERTRVQLACGVNLFKGTIWVPPVQLNASFFFCCRSRIVTIWLFNYYLYWWTFLRAGPSVVARPAPFFSFARFSSLLVHCETTFPRYIFLKDFSYFHFFFVAVGTWYRP